MPDSSTNQDSRHRLVDAFVASVAIVAIALTSLVFALGPNGVIPPSKAVYVIIFCALLFIGETRTMWFRFGDGGQCVRCEPGRPRFRNASDTTDEPC